MPVTLSVSATVATDVLEDTLLTNSANLTTAMPVAMISNEVEIRVTGGRFIGDEVGLTNRSPGESWPHHQLTEHRHSGERYPAY